MLRAAAAATQTARQDVARTSQEAFHPSLLVNFQYQPFPGAINCTTLGPTQDFAADPAHPFHTRTVQRLQSFDATKFHWRVHCPVDVSKKAFIRNWASKRLKSAITNELRKKGWNRDGTPVFPTGSRTEGETRKIEGLAGALLIILSKRAEVTLTASKAEVQQCASWLLNSIQQQRQKALVEKSCKKPDMRLSHADTREAPVRMPAQEPPLADRKSLVKPQPSARHLSEDAIREQVEYYFSDKNLPFDDFLLRLTKGPANLPVSLRTVCRFKRMRHCGSYRAVRDALKGSELLELCNTEDAGDGVRRKVPLNPRFTADVDANKMLLVRETVTQ